MLGATALCVGPCKPSFPSHPAAQKYLPKYSTGCTNAYLKMQIGARLALVTIQTDFMPVGKERHTGRKDSVESYSAAMRKE